MKKITTLILSVILIASCSKSTDAPSEKLSSQEPSISSVKFYPVYAGSNESVGFTVGLVSDSSIVSSVDLVLSPNGIRWTVTKPVTGTYKMYDHLGDYPTYAMSQYYYFVFHKKDGSKILTEPFQVY